MRLGVGVCQVESVRKLDRSGACLGLRERPSGCAADFLSLLFEQPNKGHCRRLNASCSSRSVCPSALRFLPSQAPVLLKVSRGRETQFSRFAVRQFHQQFSLETLLRFSDQLPLASTAVIAATALNDYSKRSEHSFFPTPFRRESSTYKVLPPSTCTPRKAPLDWLRGRRFVSSPLTCSKLFNYSFNSAIHLFAKLLIRRKTKNFAKLFPGARRMLVAWLGGDWARNVTECDGEFIQIFTGRCNQFTSGIMSSLNQQ